MLTTLLIAMTSLADPSSWQWPINPQHGITSSFGEYRGIRFHMGLDFSTAGVEGQPIRPAKSGRVFRIRATRRGYGRVVYIRHPEGHTTVYAHLAKFGPQIARVIEGLGKNASAYFGTLEVDIPVQADRTFAYSGESGAGLPHLHFEVRDSRNRALDPLALDFPPIATLGKRTHLKSIHLIPRSDKALVNGRNLAFEIEPGAPAIQAKGEFSLQVIGHIRGARNSRLGLRGIEVRLGDDLIGRWLPRRIDYQNNRTAGAVFDQALSGFGPTRFSYCFDGRSQYLTSPSDLKTAQPFTVSQPTSLTVSLMDQLGQWHRYSFQLNPEAKPIPRTMTSFPAIQPTSLTIASHGSSIQFIANNTPGQLLNGEETIPLIAEQNHRLTPIPGAPAQKWVWRTQSGGLSRLVGALPGNTAYHYTIGQWVLERKKPASSQNQMLWLEPPRPSLHSGVLQFESPVLRFGGEGLPVASPIAIQHKAEGLERPQQIGLYGFSRNSGKWRYKTSLNSNKRLDYSLDAFQPLVLARDIKPPTIGRPKIHQYFTGKRIVIEIRDQGSGIDSNAISIMNKAGKQKYEYDPDRNWLILPSGANGPWDVTVSDRAGLKTTRQGLNL